MRRIVDLLIAICCLIVFGPLILVIAIIIKLDSAGPVLYRPRMVGRQGRVFSLYRFRTMAVKESNLDAEPRLTRIGGFIRNISLDHLPMLINLLRGDLTLVGPRPMEPEVVDFQEETWQAYFKGKPGLFNYAVLKMGRTWTPKRVSHPELNQDLEMEYLQKRSTIFDLQLMLKFLQTFVTSKGNVKARGEPDTDVETWLGAHLH
jgi:lipopolysaccharide/colanic/teichoic acid biosynthesis glycosyltransferase